MTEKTQEETQQEQVEAVAEQVQEVLAAADEKQPEAVGEQGDPLIPVDATKVAAVDLHPFEVLQGARLALNASLGYIHGAGGTIGAADTKVKQLEAELATAQGNALRARSEALNHRQAMHHACDRTVAAIDRLRVKYPLLVEAARVP